ncbi:hypothetical protein [Actinoplanes sp. HUAS TT8]|uniref:hypothetical protein n=1 Tax=Actinoplanes sp. HUAS TT8 TaxID=3447453 RepID=UPI003F5241B8
MMIDWWPLFGPHNCSEDAAPEPAPDPEPARRCTPGRSAKVVVGGRSRRPPGGPWRRVRPRTRG